jgi:MFS family permease
MSTKELSANIWKYYAAGILQSLWFILSINILYWQSFGITYKQIGVFELVGALAIILLEIPTGAVADLVSRKMSVFIGVVIAALANFIIGFGSTLFVFATAYVVWAIGDTFISGAKSALMYDTLKDLKRENEYLKIQGRYHLYTTFALILATAVSPFLFSINKRAPYILLGIAWLISSFFILSMTEPSRRSSKYSIKKHITQMKNGFKYSINHKVIRWYFLFSILIGMPMLLYMDLISQSYYISVGYSLHHLAILIPVIYGSASLVASQAHRIENKLGENKSLMVIAGVHALGFLAMGVLRIPLVIAFVIILFMSRDFRWVVMDNYVNKHVVSKMRATVISVGSMLTFSVMAIMYPIAGKLMDFFGIFTVILGFGIFVVLCSVLLFAIKPKLIVVK